MNNYLMTNELIGPDIDNMVKWFFGMTGKGDEKTEQALRNMFEARREYLEAAYAKVEELYGDFDTFLKEGLGLTESDIQKMRDTYLESKSNEDLRSCR
jgi:protein-tyrosine phosphatase